MTAMRLAFDVVDVFTDRPFAGNQLAVVHGADELSTEQCQALAREFNFSESTFPATPDGDAYATRIFTPAQEIPFAGHPTLGTAWVLRSRGLLTADVVTQHCGAGEVGVRFEGDLVELSATPRDLAGVDMGHPGHRHEDRAAPEDLHDQPEHPGLQAARSDHRDQVTDLADLVAGRVEHRQPGQPGGEDAGRGGAHECSG